MSPLTHRNDRIPKCIPKLKRNQPSFFACKRKTCQMAGKSYLDLKVCMFPRAAGGTDTEHRDREI